MGELVGANRVKAWSKFKADLDRNRESFWEYIATVVKIVETGAYLEVYRTQQEFLDTEAGLNRQRFHELRTACQTRLNVSGITDKNIPVSHLAEISKIPEKKQAQITAGVLERCEAENREPTAKDFKAAAKPFIKPPEPVEVTEEVYEDVEEEIPVDEQASKLRSVIKQHNNAMIRAIDELHQLKPSKTRHGELLVHFRKIDELVGGWK